MRDPPVPSRAGVVAILVVAVASWLALLRWDGAPTVRRPERSEAGDAPASVDQDVRPNPEGTAKVPPRASLKPAAPPPSQGHDEKDAEVDCRGVSSFGTCEGD